MATTHRAAPPAARTALGRPWHPLRRLRPARAIATVAVAVLVVVGVVVWHAHTGTGSVPYADPAVTGRLTLCAADGTPLTKGSVTDRPFATAILGDTPASGGYAAQGRTATLLAAQPRAGVDAAEWSTLQLTPGQAYPNPSAPMVTPDRATTTLGQFLTAYPAVDAGWVQLRVVLGGRGLPTQTQTYAALDLHVSGDTWTVADPGSASCPSNP